MYLNMLLLFCACFVLATADAVQYQQYQYKKSVDGWIKPHKLVATWQEAFNKCRDEGAVLAAPTTPELVEELRLLIGDNNHSAAYFINAKARYVPGIYVTAKGFPLNRMPVSDMINSLKKSDGDCISMDSHQIRVVSCETELPFICFRKQQGNEALGECGTYDREYKLIGSTGSCYKLHKTLVSWDEAYATCDDEGGYLAIINNETEAKDVWHEYNWRVLPYIGLRAPEGGNWTSIHGDPLDTIFNKWRVCPECKSNTDPAYRCGLLNKGGKLYPWPCKGDDKHFLCERDPEQEEFYSFEK